MVSETNTNTTIVLTDTWGVGWICIKLELASLVSLDKLLFFSAWLTVVAFTTINLPSGACTTCMMAFLCGELHLKVPMYATTISGNSVLRTKEPGLSRVRMPAHNSCGRPFVVWLWWKLYVAPSIVTVRVALLYDALAPRLSVSSLRSTAVGCTGLGCVGPGTLPAGGAAAAGSLSA